MNLLVVAEVEELRTESPLLMMLKTMEKKTRWVAVGAHGIGCSCAVCGRPQASSQSNQSIVRNQTPNTESKHKHRRGLRNHFVFYHFQRGTEGGFAEFFL